MDRLTIAGLAVIDTGLSLAQRWYSARIGEGLIYDLRTAVFDHVQRMPLAFFTRTQTGALVSRLNSDVLGAQQAFTSTLSGLVSNVVSLVFTATVMFTLSWQITVLALILLPVFVLPARRIGTKLQAITRESYALNASMRDHDRAVQRGRRAAGQAVRKAPEESLSFSSRAARVRDIGVRSAMYGRTLFAALSLVASLAQALVYGLGGYYALTGQLSTGTVVALALLLTRLYGPLTALSNAGVDIMSALVSFDRVFEVLDLQPLIDDAPDAVPLRSRIGPPPASASVTSVLLSDRAGGVAGLAGGRRGVGPEAQPGGAQGVSFTAQAGQMVALVGPSGAGKTTISQLVPRIYDVRSGVVRVAGQDVDGHPAVVARRHRGASQDAHLFHDKHRGEPALRPARCQRGRAVAALTAANIADKIAELPDGLATVVGDRGTGSPAGRSNGSRSPGCCSRRRRLILDEATAHLDSESERLVQHALSAALAGRTSLVIAHRLSTIRAADQVLVVDDGRIVESGSHEELLARRSAYAELYRTQFAPDNGARPTLTDQPIAD